VGILSIDIGNRSLSMLLVKDRQFDTLW